MGKDNMLSSPVNISCFGITLYFIGVYTIKCDMEFVFACFYTHIDLSL